MEFSETLRRLREKSGMSQQEVSAKLGIKQQRLSTWETGRAMPTSDVFLRLTDLYGVKDILKEFGYASRPGEPIHPTYYELELIRKLRELDTAFRDSILQIVDYAYDLKNRQEIDDEQEQESEDDYYLAAAHGTEGMDEEQLDGVQREIAKLSQLDLED